MLTHGELFAGISGFGLGFAQSGIETLWHVEIDKHCQNVLRRHYPDTLLFSDVRECGAHNLPPVDIISFGSPCQDLSIAGKRKGLNGERSGLFFEAIRIVRELHPTYAIWENVPGALSSNGGRDFGAVLDALAESGALDIGWAIVDAQWFGVAQRRRRVFVVADFRGRRSAEILSIPEGRKGDIAPSTSTREGVAAAIVERIGKGGFTDPVNDNIISFEQNSMGGRGTLGVDENTQVLRPVKPQSDHQFVAYTIQQNDGGNHKRQDRPNGGMYVKEAEQALTVGSTDQTLAVFLHCNKGRPDGRKSKHADMVTVEDIPTCLSTDGHAQSAIAYRDVGHYGLEIVDPAGTSAPLLQGQSGGGGTNNRPHITGAMGVRRLTPTECERLQGFPDGYTDNQSDTARYRQLGNAVCAAVTTWLGKRIVEAHNSDT